MGRLRIGIAGAGTAGLAAAAFLARDGHDVSLFERFKTPKPIGAGLLLQPTGLAALARLGLDQAAIDLGQPVSQITGDTVAGVRILDLSYRDLGANVFGLGLHRGSLFQLLYAEVIRLGVALTPGSDLTGSRRTAAGRTLIDRQGGEFGPFDLVTAAPASARRYAAPRPRYAISGLTPGARCGASSPSRPTGRTRTACCSATTGVTPWSACCPSAQPPAIGAG